MRTRLASHRCTWIHAVSVGEVAIALKLLAKMRELEPEFFCVLTTTTTTGFAFARQEAGPGMEVLYSPLDFWPIMRRAYSRHSSGSRGAGGGRSLAQPGGGGEGT